MMLVHIDQPDVAERVHNAWLRTIEDGIHTYDIYNEGVSKQKVGTKEFAEAVVARLGKKPEKLKAVAYAAGRGGRRAAACALAPPRPRRRSWASTSTWPGRATTRRAGGEAGAARRAGVQASRC